MSLLVEINYINTKKGGNKKWQKQNLKEANLM
jgi:hypothetical protein